ncbi:hypothetical protein JXB41_08315 [Candidatus Woesearchaeota archaeon]|nr:hypothetical protein [Candidatus Woesearchaeota archaeon]
MNKKIILKSCSIIIIIVLITNMVLLGLRLINDLVFWIIIILGFISMNIIKYSYNKKQKKN